MEASQYYFARLPPLQCAKEGPVLAMRFVLGLLVALLKSLLSKRPAKPVDDPPQAGPLGIYRPPVDDSPSDDDVPF